VLLDERGALPPADVVRLGLQLGSALHYLHELGVAHLDVKPQNVAVRDGRAVLLDFDLASPFARRRPGSRARGSPPYMAPEQVRGEGSSPAMDLFGLGATLYEAATDHIAFEAKRNGAKSYYPQLTRSPPSVRSIVPSAPEALERAIAALLDPEPSRRPASALAALDLLAGALPRGQGRLWPPWVRTPLAG
jgi:serine/threonine protein kinase